PADNVPKIDLGDGSVIHSHGILEPGVEFTLIVDGESGFKLHDSVLLLDSRNQAGGGFLAVVRERNVCRLADVPEEDVRALGGIDLFHLAEFLRHRNPGLTWNDLVTVLHLFVFEGEF
ncbi:MAG: hypothetical protein WED08_02580, partial [Patescibacteria group bacterium]